MGCGVSSCALRGQDVETLWFSPYSERSRHHISASTGFGISRNKSFIKGISLKDSQNRKGNTNGELAGKLLVYQKATKNDNYEKYDNEPVIMLKSGSKLFAKAFLETPLGRLPIGENNMLPRKQLSKLSNGAPPQGAGPVLLAMKPRVIAVFVTVDGNLQNHEHLCRESIAAVNKSNQNFKPRPLDIESAIPNSFFTYMVSESQNEFFFIHLPIVCGLNDCELETGIYGKSMVTAFSNLFTSLGPGPHDVTVKLKCYYDHCVYNYFPLGKNINALGSWYSGLSNRYLKDPHPYHSDLYDVGDVVAEGKFKVIIPRGYSKMVEGLLNRRVPREVYWKTDKEDVRREARLIAAGHFCEMYDVDGLPDVLVLTTDLQERSKTDVESGYSYKHEYMEFAALWLNSRDQSPQAEGTLMFGGLARGEVLPREPTRAWCWHPLHRAGQIVSPQPLPVMNKYIKSKAAVSGKAPLFSKLL